MSAKKNRDVSARYHQFKVEEMDDILTPDFIGHGPRGWTWNLQKHKEYWREHAGQMHDVIDEQVAEGDTVATRFRREGTNQGKSVSVAAMNSKRFVGGKIAEIWEFWDQLKAE